MIHEEGLELHPRQDCLHGGKHDEAEMPMSLLPDLVNYFENLALPGRSGSGRSGPLADWRCWVVALGSARLTLNKYTTGSARLTFATQKHVFFAAFWNFLSGVSCGRVMYIHKTVSAVTCFSSFQ